MNDKITLSLHDRSLKERIKKYAASRGMTVSGIVEAYFKELIKVQDKNENKNFDLPEDLDNLLEGLYVRGRAKEKSYKELRNKMYHDKSGK